MENLNIFLVGGAVRDELLGLPVSEKDWVVVGSSSAEMLRRGFKKVGKEFPVFLHPITGEEYALARTEKKVAKGYYGFECDSTKEVTLEQDLLRRDLTINAMAKDLEGNLIDPFNGQKDLHTRVLRHVSVAFIEDPVRVLRVARFAAKLGNYGFKLAPETKELMKEIIHNQELEHVTPERVWKEMEKALNTQYPEKFFEILKNTGALSVIFPELNKLWGISQNKIWHPEIDVWIHTMLALQQAVKFTPDPKIRFAVLCHDLGKGNTPKEILPKHHGHEERGVKLIQQWCCKYKVPNAYKNLAMQVSRLHLHSHRAMELTPKKILQLFTALNAFRQPENLDNFLLACAADFSGRAGKQQEQYLQAQFLKKIFIKIQKINNDSFVGQGFSGKEIGEYIRKHRLNLIAEFKVIYRSIFS